MSCPGGKLEHSVWLVLIIFIYLKYKAPVTESRDATEGKREWHYRQTKEMFTGTTAKECSGQLLLLQQRGECMWSKAHSPGAGT